MAARQVRYQEFRSSAGKLIASAASYEVYRATHSIHRARKVIEHEVMDWRTGDRTVCPHFEAATLYAATLAHHA